MKISVRHTIADINCVFSDLTASFLHMSAALWDRQLKRIWSDSRVIYSVLILPLSKKHTTPLTHPESHSGYGVKWVAVSDHLRQAYGANASKNKPVCLKLKSFGLT